MSLFLYADDSLSVYVRNLPFHATEAELEGFFSQAGSVADIRRGANAEGESMQNTCHSTDECRVQTIANLTACAHPVHRCWGSTAGAGTAVGIHDALQDRILSTNTCPILTSNLSNFGHIQLTDGEMVQRARALHGADCVACKSPQPAMRFFIVSRRQAQRLRAHPVH